MTTRIRQAFAEALHFIAIVVGVGVAFGAIGALLAAGSDFGALKGAVAGVGTAGGIALGLGLISSLTVMSESVGLQPYDPPLDEPGGIKMDGVCLAAAVILLPLTGLLYLLAQAI